MPFVVEESGKENIVPVRLLSREARFYQRRFHDRERANFYTLPNCHNDSISSLRKNSRLFAGIRYALRYLTQRMYIHLSNLRGSNVQIVHIALAWLVLIQSLCARQICHAFALCIRPGVVRRVSAHARLPTRFFLSEIISNFLHIFTHGASCSI